MKTHQTTISVLFMLFFNICLSQNYKFDKIAKNSFSTKSFPNQERTDLFNSKDDSYHMQIYNRNDSLLSRIFDTKKNQIHYFNIQNSDSLEFYYLNTFSYEKKSFDYTYEFSDLKTVEDKNEIVLTIFNKNKKRATYKLKIKESDENFFPIFKLTSMEPWHFMKIVTPLNFTVIEAKGIFPDRTRIKYKLNSLENIDLVIKLPEKLVTEQKTNSIKELR